MSICTSYSELMHRSIRHIDWQDVSLRHMVDTLADHSVLSLADDNIGAQCANFCFVPGGRMICFAEDSIYLVKGLTVEGDLLSQRL